MIPFPNKKYNVIYADPPWSYKLFNGTGNGPAAKHYQTMTPEDIFNLPVQDIAADDCLLFLWVRYYDRAICQNYRARLGRLGK